MTLMETFGATSDDADAMRIPSLVEMDVPALERMWAAGGKDGAADSGATSAAQPAETFDKSADDDDA